MLGIFDIGSRELFALAGLKSQLSLFLPPLVARITGVTNSTQHTITYTRKIIHAIHKLNDRHYVR
jgi:hypothetical protein